MHSAALELLLACDLASCTIVAAIMCVLLLQGAYEIVPGSMRTFACVIDWDGRMRPCLLEFLQQRELSSQVTIPTCSCAVNV